MNNSTFLSESQNHRITEWFGLEGTLKIIWFQPPCHEQGHLPPASKTLPKFPNSIYECTDHFSSMQNYLT